MKLLLAIILPLYLSAFTPDQLKLFDLAKQIAKPYNLQNTICGIILVESQAGLYKVNPQTEDYGVTGINVYSLLRRLNIEPTHLAKSFYATQLVIDDQYAITASLAELLYWQLDRNRTDWAHLISSYNQGSKVNNYDYARKVAKAIKYLKTKGIIQ